MNYRVRVLPSGNEFEAHSGETLLDAGLRAGLNLRYSCSGGSCGECRARVLSGQLARLDHADFALSEAERAQGGVLLCRAYPGSDLTIEASEAHGVEDIPVQEIETRVEKRVELANGVLALHLRTPRSKALRFLAGQHVTLEIDGVAPRNKSIASCPCHGMQLEFHIRKVAGDAFAEQAWNGMKVQTPVRLRGPWGRFTLDEDSARPLTFIAWETGFAPIKSLIEHAIALELAQPMRLYRVSPVEGAPYLANQCRSWVDALDDFRFAAIAAPCGVASSAVMDAALERILADTPDVAGCDFYVTAPDPARGRVRDALLAGGVRPESLRMDELERF